VTRSDDELIPLKLVSHQLKVSRHTLWRAASSNTEGFPQPTRIGRRAFWRNEELPRLEVALRKYCGRGVFDATRRIERLRMASRQPVRKRRKSQTKRETPGDDGQGDLFS